MNALTPDLIVVFGAAALSCLFRYVPRLRAWYDQVGGDYKGLLMLGVLALGALVAYGGSCASFWGYVACTPDGALEVGRAWVIAVVANQVTYLISPAPKPAAAP